AARRGRAGTRGVLRRPAPGVRPAARPVAVHGVPAAGAAAPARDRIRADPHVRAGRGARREPEGGPGGRHRLRHQPAAGRRALPPGAAGRRDTGRVRRRADGKTDTAEPGGGGMSARAITDPWKERVDSGDWVSVKADLDAYGGALLPQLLT